MLERYVRAWETADIAGLVALLRDDAIVSMPPALLIAGREAIRKFLETTVFVGGVRVRLVPVGANRTPAFALYSGVGDGPLQLYALLVVDTADALVARISVFTDPRVAGRFGLAEGLPG